jgi:LysR family transcriptional regulator for metE and metH
MPGGVTPQRRQIIESTDILLQLVASGRGVSALPKWMVREYAKTFAISPVRLGKGGVKKSIHLGVRTTDAGVAHIAAFTRMAASRRAPGKARRPR